VQTSGTRVLRRYNGYTLIEVLVALVVLAIGLLGVAAAFSYAAVSARYGQNLARAQNVALSQLEKARQLPFDQIVALHAKVGETEGSEQEAEFRQAMLDAGLVDAEGWVDVTDVPYNLKAVSVVIKWEGGIPGGRIRFDTLISPRM